jgi:hypothetical protein
MIFRAEDRDMHCKNVYLDGQLKAFVFYIDTVAGELRRYQNPLTVTDDRELAVIIEFGKITYADK